MCTRLMLCKPVSFFSIMNIEYSLIPWPLPPWGPGMRLMEI